jgi:hypothetical protein
MDVDERSHINPKFYAACWELCFVLLYEKLTCQKPRLTFFPPERLTKNNMGEDSRFCRNGKMQDQK